MKNNKIFDVIIVGGSYAGLSSAMSLGRSLRSVLVIDSGNPCNKQTPHSHNFITHDGSTPGDIAAVAKSQVEKYDTIEFVNGLVISGSKQDNLFVINLETGEEFKSKKLLFATGLKDIMLDMKGFSECWGISILHCPYCHGYEVKDKHIGILGNGNSGFELAKLIHHWSKNLTLFTNGTSELTPEQIERLSKYNINIIDTEISHFAHDDGRLKSIVFKDGSGELITAMFARIPFEQKSDVPKNMGCELTEQGFIKIDEMHRTTVDGMYAVGDNSSGFRAVSIVIGAGAKAGAVINALLIEEEF
jgi:thioredoxin reductase